MKISVNDIPATGSLLQLEKDQAWCLDACRQAVDGQVATIRGELRLNKTSHHVKADGFIQIQFSRACDRCNEVTNLQAEEEFHLCYYPEESLKEEETELAVDDLGVGWYRDGMINIGDVISEVVALSLPNRLVCVDAEGCESRLVNLLGEAQVDRLTGHPGFAALKGFGNGPTG